MPLETDRSVRPPEPDDTQYVVVITGTLMADGAGPDEATAHRVAEEHYDRRRAALVREGEDFGMEEQIERVAHVLYAYHHSVVVNKGRGLPPGTPLPTAAPAPTMNHFRDEARLWLKKTGQWRTQGVREQGTEALRGRERAGVVG